MMGRDDGDLRHHECELIDVARQDAQAWNCISLETTMPSGPSLGSFPGYDVVRELHRGGQGVVYEAFQQSTNRKVAIKLLLEGPFASDASRVRFEREVRLAAGLRHPNIVVIHDSGIIHNQPFFVMALIEGQHLDAYVRTAKLSLIEIVHLMLKVIDAVAYAHRRGIVHRDLKPSNIVVDSDGAPSILDFGLAKGMSDGARQGSQGPVSISGQIVGTVRYMSPEQANGMPTDARTDIYTLGVILYELLTGSKPYETGSDFSSAVYNICHSPIRAASELNHEIDPSLQQILQKSMEKRPDLRYPSAVEMKEAMEEWLAWQKGQADALPEVSRRWRKIRRRPLIAAIFTLAIGGISINIPSLREKNFPPPDINQIVNYVVSQANLAGLNIERIPGVRPVRVRGVVLNETERVKLQGRLTQFAQYLQIEVTTNPENVRLMVQQALTKAQVEGVRVRLLGAAGHEGLTIEGQASQSVPRDRIEEIAKKYVFDSSYLSFRLF